LELWATPLGPFWVESVPVSGLAAVISEQEQEVYGNWEIGVRAGDVVLDCGASFGAYTRVALRRGAAKVIAVEISPRAIQCLQRNFANEIAAGRVVVYPKGVWDREERMTLFVDDKYQLRDSVVGTERRRPGPEVQLVRIDTLVAELGLERVDFIKMDIEGAERRALAGAIRTMQRWRPRLAISAYHLRDDPEIIRQVVLSAVPGYKVTCGMCMESNAGDRIVPGVMFFGP